MKKILFLILVLMSCCFADRALIAFKRGDKITASGKEYLGLKHGDPVQLIRESDFNNISLEEICESELMHSAFILVEIPIEEYNNFAAIIKPLDDPDPKKYRPRKWRMLYNRLGQVTGAVNLKNRAKTKEKIPILNGLFLRPSDFTNAGYLWNDRLIPDLCATTGGSVTFGSGGTFATMALLFADLGNLTSNLIATMVSAITETAQATMTENFDSFTFTITSTAHYGDPSAGHLMSVSYTSHLLNLQGEGAGKIIIENMNIKRTAVVTSVKTILRIVSVDVGYTLEAKNNIFNGNGQGGSAFLVDDADVLIHCYNNITCGLYDGFLISELDGNSSSIFENNTIYGCSNVGLLLNNNAGTYQNNVMFANGTNVTLIGSATGKNNADSDNTAADANWGTGTGNLNSLVAADEFESLDCATGGANYLLPKTTSNLSGAGIAPTISGHTLYLNGVSINTGNVFIGAKGLITAGTPENYRKSKYFPWGDSWMNWSKRLRNKNIAD